MGTTDYSLPVGPLRTDALLIRHFSRPGDISIPGNPAFDTRLIYPRLAETYRRLPLFVLPDNIPWLFEHEEDLVPFLYRRIHLPYDDLILDFPLAGEVLFRHALGKSSDVPPRPQHLWVRIRSVSQALNDHNLIWPTDILRQPIATLLDDVIPSEDRDPPGSPISEEDILDDATNWLLCELWYLHPDGVSHYPRWTLIPRGDPTSTGIFHYFYPEDEASDATWYRGELLEKDLGPATVPPSFEAVRNYVLLLEEAHARAILLALVYLTEVATLLRVSPPPSRNEKQQKTLLLKPWLGPREHAIISVDPDRLAEYHHPSATQIINIRHAPRPHSRRGHWRTMPEGWSKFRTWIRPTWVGAREWQDPQGNTYVFLPPTVAPLSLASRSE